MYNKGYGIPCTLYILVAEDMDINIKKIYFFHHDRQIINLMWIYILL